MTAPARTATIALCIALAVFPVGLAGGPAEAETFPVTDSSFAGDVYTFRYLTRYDQAYVNGTLTPFTSLFGTNSGWNRSSWPDGAFYWQGPCCPATPYSINATMGWDLTAATRQLTKVELQVGNWLFSYDPIYFYSGGDTIGGRVSTDGGASWASMYTYVGPGNDSVAVVGLWGLDITGLLSPLWLADPGLLGLDFGFTDISTPLWGIGPSNAQLFRDGPPPLATLADELGAGDSFMLRLTAAPLESSGVPLPGTLWLVLLGATAAGGLRRLRRGR